MQGERGGISFLHPHSEKKKKKEREGKERGRVLTFAARGGKKLGKKERKERSASLSTALGGEKIKDRGKGEPVFFSLTEEKTEGKKRDSFFPPQKRGTKKKRGKERSKHSIQRRPEKTGEKRKKQTGSN